MNPPAAAAPKTPPRRVGMSSSTSGMGSVGRRTHHLTPTMPFVTPSKTAACTSASVLRGGGFGSASLVRCRTSPARRLLKTTAGTATAATPISHKRSRPLFETDDDRYIPSRSRMNLDLCRRSLMSGEKRSRYEDDGTNGSDDNGDDDDAANVGGRSSSASSSPSRNRSSPTTRPPPTQETSLQKEFKRRMLSSLCNVPLDKLNEEAEPKGLLAFGGSSSSFSTGSASRSEGNSVSGTPHRRRGKMTQRWAAGAAGIPASGDPFALDTLRTMKLGGDVDSDAAATFQVASKVHRKVSCAPTRILDAPDIVDDYYLNLISWSKDNILAVALARSVYLWNGTTGDIHTLITVDQGNDYITSVNWCTAPGQTKYIAIGTNNNVVHLMDGHSLQRVRTLAGHSSRVSALAWSPHNQGLLTSGSRDSRILNHDVRVPYHVVSRYDAHLQEVCGLKWNEEGTCLASGGNENYLCLWDAAMSGASSSSSSRARARGRQGNNNHYEPRLILKEHKAAVKALDWCPFYRGLLASGGGTADRSIKFWNASSGAMLNSVDTGSQVCSILWSKQQRELCSSHGFSENQLILWKYPSMTKVAELTGHTARVLNMDMSPDGSSIVSAGADETLRFWDVFERSSRLQDKHHHGAASALLLQGVGGGGALQGLTGGTVIR